MIRCPICNATVSVSDLDGRILLHTKYDETLQAIVCPGSKQRPPRRVEGRSGR